MLSIPITQKETTCGCLQHAYVHVTDKINKTKKRKSQTTLLCLNSKESMTTDRSRDFNKTFRLSLVSVKNS